VKKDRPAPVSRSVERRSLEGATLGTVELEPTIFGIEPNMAVLHQVVTAQLAAKRAGTQSTKTRKEVSGGGKKPFRQKAPVARARARPARRTTRAVASPSGPSPRKYDQKTPKKMIRLALYSALSDRAAESRVALVDSFDAWSEPKTKAALGALGALGLEGKVLVVLNRGDAVAYYSFNNLDHVKTIDEGEINAYDVLEADWVLFTDATLPRVKEDN